jgi:MoxR-like ATPase
MTPDLLPGDILGVSLYSQARGEFEFKRGPIFAHVVLADEINRTTPRTQSALLEAMNEGQVSVDGQAMLLPQPFMVLATQNPFEFEGTYFLPENQLDRFLMRVRIGYPARADERRILNASPALATLAAMQPVASADQVLRLQQAAAAVELADNLQEYLLDIVEATRRHEMLHIGVSPRGALALKRASQAYAMVRGRLYVVPDDIKKLAAPVLAHRLVGRALLGGQDGSAEALIGEILGHIAAPQ